jgi:membrane protease YdiL (CAAX protease family)
MTTPTRAAAPPGLRALRPLGAAFRARLEAALEGERAFRWGLVVLGASGAAAHVAPVAAVAVDGAVLAIVAWVAVGARRAERRSIALGLAVPALVPIIVFATTNEEATPVGYALTGIPLLIAGVVTARALELNPRAWFRLPRRAWRREAAIALAGPPLGLAAYLLLGSPTRPGGVDLPAGIGGLLVLAFAALPEELLFRGVVQSVGLRVLGAPRRAVLLSTATATVAWLPFGSVPVIAVVAATSAGFGWAAWRSGSLVGVTLAHALMVGGVAFVWPVVLGG